MSINVTVSGNPVRINRGKMVTAYDPAKTEFEKRRLMRLEQVRQQSKDIAENVRNKHKKAKAQCLSEIEKEGEVKLKNWQARKLLELQDQYQEALDDIGLGHKGATCVEEEDEIFVEQTESNEKIARERGRVAAERLQIEKNEENLRKAAPRQRKVVSSDVENTRASGVANSRKDKAVKSPHKKVKKKQTFDSDEENRIPKLVLDYESNVESSSSSDFEEMLRKRSDPERNKQQQTTTKTSKEQQTSVTMLEVPTSDKAEQTIIHEDPVLHEAPLDTRISERIRRRARPNSETDYCDFHDKTRPNCCTHCQCLSRHQEKPPENVNTYNERDLFTRDSELQNVTNFENGERFKNSERSIPVVPKNTQILFQKDQNFAKESEPEKSGISLEKSVQTVPTFKHDKIANKATSLGKSQKTNKPEATKSTIPAKPKVTLRATKGRPVYIGTDPNPQPVQFYDHPNRYSRSYIPKTSHVEKIDDEQLIVSPNINEEEIREKMRQRDIEAQIRGQVALEKEKIQREYRDLLRKLPALQKQERIFEIGTDKEKYHMSRDRLEDLEKRRQNRLDNAYEELFVRQKPAVVTLPKRSEEKDEDVSLNLASWDNDFDPLDPNKSRSEQLSHMLSNLRSQKVSLLKEIGNTISKDALSQLTNKTSAEDVKSKSTDYTQIRRKRSRDERPVSPTSSDVILEEESSRRTKSKKSSVSSTGGTSMPSPRKKPKLKSSRKVLVLQNTSTQTTPQTRTATQSAATSPIVKTPTTDICSCRQDDDVCEIVIKLKDDDKPEVSVNPPYSGRSVTVVTEDVLPAKEQSPKEIPEAKKVSEGKKVKVPDLWKDQLGNSGSSHSTTSTSYLEPPSSGRSKKAKKTTKSPPEDAAKSTDSTNDKRLDPRLLTYIQKLLNMSRTSIDDLTVSTGSEISTPSHSVLETPSNNPLYQLMNVMKYFNLDAAEVQKQLSYVSDGSSRQYNTVESIALTSSSSEGDRFRSCTDVDNHKNDKLLKYADIAAHCTKKINNLTAMIEKVRAEKKKMIESSTSGSEKDLTTTSYKDLPDKKQNESSSNDLDALLKIDYSYAEKLKHLSKEDIAKERQRIEGEPSDDELLKRLKRLLQNHEKTVDKPRTVVQETQKTIVQEESGRPVGLTVEKRLIEDTKDGKTVGIESTKTKVQFKPTEDKESSPPLFLDIPKLPKLEAPSLDRKKKRPPTCKGLRVIAANAHELSTIMEGDSQLSTKVDSPIKDKSGSSSKSSDMADIVAQARSQSTPSSSDDVSELETMETLLTSIGMEWAIPTLKKTREALAMTSSSNGSGSKESGGEVSLREFLSRISASSSKSGEGSLNESAGVSIISVDNRKTSTPIVDQGERRDGQPVFLTDSDVSSVREYSKDKDGVKSFEFVEGSLDQNISGKIDSI